MKSLVYHSISSENNIICISPDIFHKQITLLNKNGFKSITLNNKSDFFDKNNILITFDDGFKNIYTKAFPILKEFGYKGNIFINASKIEKEDIRLSIKEIEKLIENGWSVQCHSFNHLSLLKLINESFDEWKNRVKDNILKSKDFFKKKLGFEPEYISYPYGYFSKEVEKILFDLEYKNGFSINEGLNNREQFSYNRLFVKNNINRSKFLDFIDSDELFLNETFPQNAELVQNKIKFIKVKILLKREDLINNSDLPKVNITLTNSPNKKIIQNIDINYKNNRNLIEAYLKLEVFDNYEAGFYSLKFQIENKINSLCFVLT